MAWFPGVQTVELQFGKAYATLGDFVPGSLILNAVMPGTRYLVWAATGDVFIPGQATAAASGGTVGSMSVPDVSQDGWLDEFGNPYKNWRYEMTLTYTVGSSKIDLTRTLYPVASQSPIDLDTVVSSGTSAPIIAIRFPIKTINGVGPDSSGNVDVAGGGGGGTVDQTARDAATTAQSRADSAYTLANGKYAKPGTGIPPTDLTTAIQSQLTLASSAYQKAGTGIPLGDTSQEIRDAIALAKTATQGGYILPASKIPSTDLATAVQTSLGKADSAYQKPGTGITTADFAAAVTASLAKADSAVQAAGLTKAAVGLGNVDNTSDANKPVSTATQTALNAKADLVGGLIPSSQLPSLATSEIVVVASQAAMLALTSTQVQRGDLAVRTDGAGTFFLNATDPSVLGNWVNLNAPTDVVTSVAGRQGVVVLAKSDVGLANVDNTADSAKPISSAQQTALDGKAALSHTHTASQISDASTVGRNVLTAADAAAARTAIGAGTGSSNLVIGTAAGTAKDGAYQPSASNISDSTTVGRSLITAADAATARSSIGAGTSSLIIGTAAGTAKDGAYQPTAANISDSTATGRTLLTAASAAAAKTALALDQVDNTSDVNKPVSSAVQTALNGKTTITTVPSGTTTIAAGSPVGAYFFLAS